MDKLKGILVYHFWILSVLALILPLAGWWMSTSAMLSEYNSRSSALESQFSSVSSGGAKPNDNWTKPLVELNQQEARLVNQTRQILWENQAQLMTWPENIAGAMNELRYMAPIGDEERTLYRSSYRVEVEKTWELVRPIRKLQDGTTDGLVSFPLEGIPSDDWDSSPFLPASDRMWESQEDIWLMRTILSSIDAVNVTEGATTPFDAPIKEITLIEFRGGGPKAASGGGGGDAGGGPAGDVGASAVAGDATMGLGRRNSSAKIGASFDPAEEFGPDTDNSGGGDAGGGGAEAAPAAAEGLGAVAGGGGGGRRKKRYIEENEDYKTRGFYLEVVIDHRKVPDLLVSLANSPWPIRVVRVQQVDRDRTDIASQGSSGGNSRTIGGRGIGNLPPPGGGAAFGQANIDAGGGVTTTDLKAAMSDPYLVDLAVAGVITIYLPPPETAEGEGAIVEETPVPETEEVPVPVPVTEPLAPAPESTDTPAPVESVPSPEDEDTVPVTPEPAPAPAVDSEEETS